MVYVTNTNLVVFVFNDNNKRKEKITLCSRIITFVTLIKIGVFNAYSKDSAGFILRLIIQFLWITKPTCALHFVSIFVIFFFVAIFFNNINNKKKLCHKNICYVYLVSYVICYIWCLNYNLLIFLYNFWKLSV